MLIEKRLESMLKAVQLKGSLSFQEAIELTGCSKDTVRRDFIKLSEQNLVTRTRGGILRLESSIFSYDKGFSDQTGSVDLNSGLNSPEIKNFRQKDSIGRLAASMVKDNQTILIDSGSTTFMMAKHLAQRENLTVLTNCLRITNELSNRADIHTILLGGDLNTEALNTIGPDAINMIKHYHADVLYLGVAAVSIEKGLMSPISMEAMLKKEMITSADEIILLADSSKIPKYALYSFAEITDITTLITDSGISPEVKHELELMNIKVEITVS